MGLVKRFVFCLLVVSACLWSATRMAVAGQASDPTDITSWSGTWEGTSQDVPAGSCFAGGLPKPQPTRLVLEVKVDGTVVAGVRPLGGGLEDGKALWRERVEKDLKVRLVPPVSASCDGQPRAYRIEYRGRFKKPHETWRLELEGQDAACADMGCTVTKQLKLARP